jgi:PAS domain S-box-containing protein
MPILDKIRNMSIQRKLLLIILATLAVSLVLVMVGIVGYELGTYRKRLAREVTDVGAFIAANCGPTLAFDDAQTAREVLATLKGSPAVAFAALYAADGRIFASYSRSDQRSTPAPAKPGPARLEFGLHQLELVRPVQQKGLPLGTLYLRADMASVYPRLMSYAGTVLLVSVAIGAGAFLLQRLLQRLVSAPLLEFSGMAERIAGGDLTASVPVRSGDEIGRLAQAFNRMTGELQQSYKELQQSRARLAGILETALDAIITTDAHRRILLFNAAAEQMFRSTSDEAKGNLIDRYIPAGFDASVTTGQTALGELNGVRPNGEEFPIEASVSALEEGGSTLFTVIIRDVTERKQAEEALRASERRLRRAEEIAHFGYWRYDVTTDHMTWSDETYRIHGVKPAEFEQTLDSYLQFVHPDDRDLLDQALKKRELDLQYRIIRPNGVLRYLTLTGEVQHDERGSIVALFGTFLDMTELRQTERDLQEKNTELERFTYTVSHDLKSPLVTVKTFLGYLEQDMASLNGDRVQKDMFYIRNAAEKMEVLLNELLEMSRIGRQVNPPAPVTFGELVEDALQAVAGSISEQGVQVKVSGDATMYGDRRRLAEIWQNLVENAVKFMGEQASPRIEIGVERVGAETVFFVRDNGIGINPRYADKIFGLFEKLDAKSKGTGLGLALVKRIVEFYQGKIWLESPGEGQGTCFRFTLPGALKTSAPGSKGAKS